MASAKTNDITLSVPWRFSIVINPYEVVIKTFREEGLNLLALH